MERRRDLIVGTFVVAMLIAFIVWLAILAGRTGATDPYYSHYDNVTGISPGTQVFFEGYRVGIVNSVQPTRDVSKRFRVDLAIARDWPIPVDSVAEISQAQGLLSAIIIDIRAGDATQSLPPGSEIMGGVAQSIVAALSSVAGDVTRLIDENLAPLLNSLGEQAPEILENLNDFTREIQKTAHSLNLIVSSENADKVGHILGDVEGTAGNLEVVSKELGATRERLDRLLVSVNELVEQNTANVSQVVLDLRDMLEALSPRVDAISRNLEVTTRNLSEFSLQIRENPGVLVRGRNASEGASE
jgi:phospholipid/cholesterol/gamma-HCH transport system substrate-binding protein